MLIFSDLFFLRLFRILGNWEIPGNGAHFSSGKKVPKLNRAMGHPSFFRGVKLKVEWNLKNSLGACRGYQWDPQKAKKKINNGEFLHPIFTGIWTWDPSRCWKIVFKLLKWQFNQSFWQELSYEKFFHLRALSLRGVGVEASLFWKRIFLGCEL